MARRKLVNQLKLEKYNSGTSIQKRHQIISKKQRAALKEIALSDIEL